MVADRYYDALGLADVAAYYSDSSALEEWQTLRDGRVIPARRLEHRVHVSHAIAPVVLRDALNGATLAPTGIAMTSVLTIDLDAKTTSYTARADYKSADRIGEFLRRSGPTHPAKSAARSRAAVAEACRSTIDQLRAAAPAVAFFLESTPHGLHASVRFDRPLPVDVVNTLGRVLLERVTLPPEVKAEVFPKLEGGRGRHCDLPGVGKYRRVREDNLAKVVNGRRLQDVVDFLTMTTTTIAAFPNARVRVHAVADMPSRPAPRTTVPGKRPTELPTWEGPSDTRQMFGHEFKKQMSSLLRHVPDDCSWRAVTKFVACCTYLAIDEATARAAFDAWIALPGHAADHMHDEGGRRALGAIYKSCVRHQQRGIDAGRVEPGLMQSPEIRSRILALAGRPNLNRAGRNRGPLGPRDAVSRVVPETEVAA